MSKLLKKRVARELSDVFKDVDSFVAFNYHKMTAEQVFLLRNYLRQQNVYVKIVHNRLASVAFSEVRRNSMKDLLKGATAIAYGGDSPVDVAKHLLDWNKKNKAITIKGGCLSNKLLDKKQVEALAKVPPKPVLLSMLAGSFESPLRQVATVVKAPVQELGYALRSLVDKMEKQSA